VRYAIVSDVHANLESLTAVLARIAEDDEVLCLGDLVGYGPNPNECTDLLRARVSACVLGNHDVAAIDNFGLETMNPAAREAIVWTQSVLGAEQAKWLDGLGYEVRTEEFLLVHGAPVNYFTYILDKAAAAEAFSATDAQLVFVGHTHIADYYSLDGEGRLEHGHRQQGGTLALEPDKRYIVNAGSVGQPRDLNPEASFLFYDPEARSVVWERAAYPIARVREKIIEAGLPDYLAARLGAGR
jgi:predicted phosphodiesterase